ncbi:MAG: class II aldolase/adducin family protein [Desulfovibrio sp.]|nr:class II aldolase/adducin family protein [Desulfovibrio sp.]
MTDKQGMDYKARILRVMRMAWQTGILRGFSGNASVRLENGDFLITASGVAKGSLMESSLLLVNARGEIIEGQGKPSIELGMHLQLYRLVPACSAILHTHPVYLHALPLLLGKDTREKMLSLDSAESDYWRERLVLTGEHAPGSTELARAVAAALNREWPVAPPLPCALWLASHGLCALAESIEAALGISEQLEHLAEIQWAVLAGKA